MAEEDAPARPDEQEPTTRAALSTRMVIALVVIAVFSGVLVAKFWSPAQRTDLGGGTTVASVTSARNDASADYEAATKTGKPIYVLFHSLS